MAYMLEYELDKWWIIEGDGGITYVPLAVTGGILPTNETYDAFLDYTEWPEIYSVELTPEPKWGVRLDRTVEAIFDTEQEARDFGAKHIP
jgi:hypothetical protein